MSRIALGEPAKRCPREGEPSIDVPRWAGMALAVVGIAVGLAGCCLWQTQAIERHVLDYPKPPKSVEESVPETLMVYHFLLGDGVDPNNLIIENADRKKYSTVLQWEKNPSDMITDLVLRDLAASGLFAKTVDQWSTVRYRYALEGRLNKMLGTVSKGKAEAVLEADATLLDFETPLGATKKIMRKTYNIRVQSVDAKPDSIARAMNLAVRRLSKRIQSDIRKSLETPHATDGRAELQANRRMNLRLGSVLGQAS